MQSLLHTEEKSNVRVIHGKDETLNISTFKCKLIVMIRIALNDMVCRYQGSSTGEINDKQSSAFPLC